MWSWSSTARCFRPARARSRRARPRSKAASRRRSPRRRSTRSAPRACARSAWSTRPSAPVMSKSAVGGGMESMSNAPYLLPGARFGFRMGDVKAVDAMTHDGLTNPFTDLQMINEASEVSNDLGVERDDMDRFAARSHELAAKAREDRRICRGDRAGHGQGPQGRDHRRHRRGDPPRRDAGEPGQAEGDRRRRPRPTPPATPRA